MATAKVACITSILQVPLICNAVTQSELAHLLEMRRQREALDEQITEAEVSLRAALEVGAAVEVGIFRAYLKVTERRSVAWKAVVERELGEDYATRVLAATKPDKFSALVVSA
jgi:predicted RNase H-related nuclease YkuK (DUF458 family)